MSTFREWLEEEIAHLRTIKRTEFGDHALWQFEETLRQYDRRLVSVSPEVSEKSDTETTHLDFQVHQSAGPNLG